jgi:hypothetical protein
VLQSSIVREAQQKKDSISTENRWRDRMSSEPRRTCDLQCTGDFVRNKKSETWINSGYFIFHREIFDYIRDGEEPAWSHLIG